MIKKQLRLCLIGIVGLLHMGAASAATIELIPSSNSIIEGNPLTVDIFITELGPTEIVSTFDIDVSFDETVLDLTAVTFGDLLGDPIIDALALEFPGTGIIGLQETSFLDDVTLSIIQDDGDPLANSVFLASLSFLSIGAGSGGLEFALNDIFGGLFDPPPDVTNPTGSTDVSVSPVPLPGAAWLMLTGLMAIGFTSRKRGVNKVSE